MQAGALGKTLARASTVGKPSKPYKPTNASHLGGLAGRAFRASQNSAYIGFINEQPAGFGQKLARTSTVGKPSKPYKPTKWRALRAIKRGRLGISSSNDWELVKRRPES